MEKILRVLFIQALFPVFFSPLPPLFFPFLFLLSSSPLLLFLFSSTPPLCSTGEFLSLAAMDTFLRSVQPEVNDLFVLSLVLINLLAWMDLFITQVTSCFSIRRQGESKLSAFTQIQVLDAFYLGFSIYLFLCYKRRVGVLRAQIVWASYYFGSCPVGAAAQSNKAKIYNTVGTNHGE